MATLTCVYIGDLKVLARIILNWETNLGMSVMSPHVDGQTNGQTKSDLEAVTQLKQY